MSDTKLSREVAVGAARSVGFVIVLGLVAVPLMVAGYTYASVETERAQDALEQARAERRLAERTDGVLCAELTIDCEPKRLVKRCARDGMALWYQGEGPVGAPTDPSSMITCQDHDRCLGRARALACD